MWAGPRAGRVREHARAEMALRLPDGFGCDHADLNGAVSVVQAGGVAVKLVGVRGFEPPASTART